MEDLARSDIVSCVAPVVTVQPQQVSVSDNVGVAGIARLPQQPFGSQSSESVGLVFRSGGFSVPLSAGVCGGCGEPCLRCAQPRPALVHCKKCRFRNSGVGLYEFCVFCSCSQCEYSPWVYDKPRSVCKRMLFLDLPMVVPLPYGHLCKRDVVHGVLCKNCWEWRAVVGDRSCCYIAAVSSYLFWKWFQVMNVNCIACVYDKCVSGWANMCLPCAVDLEKEAVHVCCKHEEMPQLELADGPVGSNESACVSWEDIPDARVQMMAGSVSMACGPDDEMDEWVPSARPEQLRRVERRFGNMDHLYSLVGVSPDNGKQVVVEEVVDVPSVVVPCPYDWREIQAKAREESSIRGCMYTRFLGHMSKHAPLTRPRLGEAACALDGEIRWYNVEHPLPVDADDIERDNVGVCVQSRILNCGYRNCRSEYGFPGWVCKECCDCDTAGFGDGWCANACKMAMSVNSYAYSNPFVMFALHRHGVVENEIVLRHLECFPSQQIARAKMQGPSGISAALKWLKDAGKKTVKVGKGVLQAGETLHDAAVGVQAFVKRLCDSFFETPLGQVISWCWEKFTSVVGTVGELLSDHRNVATLGVIFCVIFHRKIGEYCGVAFDLLATFWDEVSKGFVGAISDMKLAVIGWFANLWRLIKGKVPKTEEQEPSEDERDGVAQSFAPSGGAVVLAAALVGALPGLRDPSAVVPSAVRSAMMLTAAAEYASTGVEYIVKRLPDTVREVLVDSGIYTPQDVDVELDQRLQRGCIYMAALADNKMDVEMARDCGILYEQLQAELIHVEVSPTRAAIVGATRTMCDRIRSKIAEINAIAESKPKQEPEGAYFFGDPGIGKSVIDDLLVKVLFPGESDVVYYNNAADPFMSGVKPKLHKVFVQDDWYQSDVKIAELANALICMMSKADFRPSLPVAEDKGQRYDPELILLTSNKSFATEIPGIDMGAFRRRFRHSYKVVCAEQVLDPVNKVFSLERFNKLGPNDRAQLKHCTFYPWKKNGQLIAGGDYDPNQPMSFLDVAYKIKLGLLMQKRIAQSTDGLALSATAMFKRFCEYMEYKELDALPEPQRDGFLWEDIRGAAPQMVRNGQQKMRVQKADAAVLMMKRNFLLSIKKIYWIRHGTEVQALDDQGEKWEVVVHGYDEFLSAGDDRRVIQRMYDLYSGWLFPIMVEYGFEHHVPAYHGKAKTFLEEAMKGLEADPLELPWLPYLERVLVEERTGADTAHLVERLRIALDKRDDIEGVYAIADVEEKDDEPLVIKENFKRPSLWNKLPDTSRFDAWFAREVKPKVADAVAYEPTCAGEAIIDLTPAECKQVVEKEDEEKKFKWDGARRRVKKWLQVSSFDKYKSFAIDLAKVCAVSGVIVASLVFARKMLTSTLAPVKKKNDGVPRFQKGLQFEQPEPMVRQDGKKKYAAKEDLKEAKTQANELESNGREGRAVDRFLKARQVYILKRLKDKNFAKGKQRWERSALAGQEFETRGKGHAQASGEGVEKAEEFVKKELDALGSRRFGLCIRDYLNQNRVPWKMYYIAVALGRALFKKYGSICEKVGCFPTQAMPCDAMSGCVQDGHWSELITGALEGMETCCGHRFKDKCELFVAKWREREEMDIMAQVVDETNPLLPMALGDKEYLCFSLTKWMELLADDQAWLDLQCDDCAGRRGGFAQAAASKDLSWDATRTVVGRINRNQCMVARDGCHLYGFFLKGRQLVAPLHFYLEKGEFIEDGTRIRVRCDGVTFDFEFERKLLRQEHLENLEARYQMDYSCYEIPEKVGRLKQTTVPSFPDISKYFTPERLTEKLLSKPTMMGVRYDDSVGCVSVLFNQFHVVNVRGTYRSHGMKESNLCIPGQLLYDLLDEGDCGTLLLACEPAGKVTIVGMHVAERPYGAGHLGMGFPMWEGMFESGEAQAYKTKLEQCGRLSYAPPPVEKPSKIVKSPLFDHKICAEVTKKPAHLGQSTCPFTAEELMYRELDRGIADDEYIAYPYDEVEYAQVQSAVRDSYFRVSRKDPDRIRKLSIQEALSGGAAGPHKGLAPISLATCSGDPWCFLPGANGKHHLFRGEAGNREIWNMDFELFFTDYLDKLRDEDMGDYMEKVVLFLKDELRSALKTMPDDPRTRVIQCFGAHHLLAMRMYFGAFTDFCHTNHVMLPSAVGMDPYSKDWDSLIQVLRQVGKRGFDGDYKKFEKYFCDQIAKGFVELVNEWYNTFGVSNEEDDLVRYNLVKLTLECQLVVGNKAYMQRGQLKSGVSLTSIMGSYMNDVMLRLAWIWVHKNINLETDMGEYDACVRKSTFSDDNINIVKEEKLEIYNFCTVRDEFAKRGIEYTPADKSDRVEAFKDFTDLEFLKCKTRVDRGIVPGITFFAVPTEPGDFTSLAYVSKGLDPLEAVATNAGSLLMRHFGRGRVAFKMLSDQLRLALHDIGSEARLPTFEEGLQRYRNGVLNRVDEADELIYQVIDETWGPRSIFLTNEMRDFYRHIVPEQRAQLPMTIEYWQQTYLEDIPGARCQMMGDQGPLDEEPIVVSVVEPRAVGEVGDNENRARSWQGADLTDLMKRFTVCATTLTSNAGILPLNYLLLQNPSIDPLGQGAFMPFCRSQGALYMYSRMYAFWWTGFRFRITGNMGLFVGYATEIPVDQPILGSFPGNADQNIGNMGPLMIAQGTEEGPMNFQVEPYTQWNFFRKPLNQAMADADTFCCDNKLLFNALNASTRNPQMYAAAGDNPYFFCLREVPLTTFFAGKKRGAMVDLGAKAQSGTGVTMVSSAVMQSQENVKPYLNPNHVHGGAEIQYQLSTMAERRQLIQVFDWTTAHAENHIVASYSIPGDLIKGSACVPFNSFTYWAGETCVYFELNSTFSMEGLLLVYFVPDMPIARINQHIATSKVSQLLNPHMWIDLGGSRSCLFKIPFLHPLLRFDTAEINVGYSPLSIVNLGTLVVSVFNPILVGADAVSTTARISTYASFPTGSPSSWTLLRGNPLSLFPLTFKGEDEKDEEVVIRKKSRKGMLLDLKARPQGVISSIMGGTRNLLRVARIGIDAAIATHNIVGGRNDKPALTQPLPIIMRGRSLIMCNTEGIEQFAQLGARLTEMRSLSSNDVGTTIRETNIDHIATQWHYLEVILWTTSDTVGDVLLNQPTYITPGILSTAAAGGFPFQMTALEYVIHQWNYWSCKSYEYRLLFTKSKVTSGRLFVSVTYQAEDLSPVTFEQAVAGYGVYLDITGDEREYVVEVPWNSDRCRYPVPHSPGFVNLDSIAYALITVWVVNSLVIDITGPQQIYINTFFRVKGIEPEATGYGTWNMNVVEPYT